MIILEAQDLKLHYSITRGIVRAVDCISFSVKEGEALGIVGESGSGKTSLALAIIRLLPHNVHTYTGSLTLEGRDLMKLSDEEFRRTVRWRKVSMVFQGAMNSLNPVMKVGLQVAEPLLLDGAIDKREVFRRASLLLKMCGLSDDVFHRYPHELSGGMKQRIIIAMSLILQPKMVILDEPTSALDTSIQAQIINMLKRFKRELRLSMIFITHDIALASDICDRIAVTYGGEIIEIGDSEHLLTNPQHPYTQKLLASTPRLHLDIQPEYIPGSPPDLVNPPSGCRFHPRCPSVFKSCSIEKPPAFQLNEEHTARCWLHRDRL